MSETQNIPAVPPTYSEAELSGVSTYSDALKLAGHGWINPAGEFDQSRQVLGNGFTIVPTAEKARLVGVPFFILSWSVNKATKGGDSFVSMLVVTQDENEKLIVNDGGTGIRAQLDGLVKLRKEQKPGLSPDVYQTNVWVNNGLRVSRYKYTDEKGREQDAETYYLD